MRIYYPSFLNYELKLSMLRNDILPENVLKDWPIPVWKCTGHLNKISVSFGPGGVGVGYFFENSSHALFAYDRQQISLHSLC